MKLENLQMTDDGDFSKEIVLATCVTKGWIISLAEGE